MEVDDFISIFILYIFSGFTKRYSNTLGTDLLQPSSSLNVCKDVKYFHQDSYFWVCLENKTDLKMKPYVCVTWLVD